MSSEADERPEGETPVPEQPQAQTPVVEAPVVEAPEAPAETVEAPAETVEAPAADAPVAEEPVAETTEAPAADAPEPETADAPAEDAPAAEATDAPAEDPPAAKAEGKPKGKRGDRKRGRRPDPARNLPKTRAVLPLDELRDASRATLELFGRTSVRESFLILAPRERQDLSALIAQDEDHRPRARNIANGSLGAGRIDKAMSATIVSMAKPEDLWAVTLDKELAAQKLGRIRQAKQRDEQRAKRAEERANRADRVSKEDMAKASDGNVGATIRIVTEEERRSRHKSDKPAAEPKRSSVLDKLGY